MIQQLHSNKLYELIKARDALIKERPELEALQIELERRLRGAGTTHNRCLIIKQMMMESMNRLSEEMTELSNLLNSLPKILK